MAQRTVGGRPHWNEGYDLFQRITNVLFFKIVFFSQQQHKWAEIQPKFESRTYIELSSLVFNACWRVAAVWVCHVGHSRRRHGSFARLFSFPFKEPYLVKVDVSERQISQLTQEEGKSFTV